MARRRSQHTGSISERRPGVWCIRISYGKDHRTGTYIREAYTVRGTKREAEDFLLEKRAAIKNEHHGPLREARRLPFGVYGLDALARHQRTADQTKELALYQFTHYTPAELQNAKLADITPAMLADAREALLKQPSRRRAEDGQPARLSVKTVQTVLSLWSTVFKTAVRERRLATNPMREVDAPQVKDSRPVGKALTPEETDRVLAAAEDDRWEALWRLLLTLGPRPSEALALTWADINWDKSEARIERSLVVVGGVPRFASTKTGKARTVPLPLPVRVAFERHRERQEAEKAAAGEGYQDRGLVFADPAGRFVPARLIKRPWHRLLRKAGITTHYRLYDTRHTAITRMVEHGVDFINIARIVGNSAKMIADVYGHARIDVQRAALEAIAAAQRPPRLEVVR